MSADDATPLQLAIREAVASSGRKRDHFDTRLQSILGTKGKTLYDIDRGKNKRPSLQVLRAIENVLGLPEDRLVDLVYPRDERPAKQVTTDHPPMRTADGGETAPVLRLDLSYSMGPGTNLDDSYIESEAIEFDIGFLRTITITPPDRIRIVDGIGDSMTPTLHDRDLLFVDINQRDLNAQDRIWAVWIYGLGAVKRLRAIGPDRVLVISDNPDMPDQEVKREDIVIHGRVVGSIKRH